MTQLQTDYILAISYALQLAIHSKYKRKKSSAYNHRYTFVAWNQSIKK